MSTMPTLDDVDIGAPVDLEEPPDEVEVEFKHDMTPIPHYYSSSDSSIRSSSTVGNSHITEQLTACEDNEVLITSSSSSCCRICQVGDEIAGDSLTTSRCFCRGHLAKVHHSCLAEWVRYRGSNRCEICTGTFQDIPAPPTRNLDLRLFHEQIGEPRPFPEQQEFIYYQALDYLRHQLPQFQLSRRKRTAVAASIVFLLLITVVSAVLTIGASRTYDKVNSDPNTSVDDVRKNHVVFSICLSFSFFCVTLTLGLALMWLVLECYFHIQRRRLLQQTAERFLSLRRRIRRPPETLV